MNQRQERTQSSMLWSAWADALGFISELTSEENLRRRTGGRELTQPMAWSRRIGGRMGVLTELPEGCYSDDTQLRLATSRAISHHGFDVEAFSRVELPVWLGYALGGGRASRAAASGMAKQQANWANNFFEGWERAGGNGAAMRIQPHVYAARDLSSMHHLDDVLRNAVVTHGHPRGLVGAVFHAVSLTFTLERGTVPDPSDYSILLDTTREAFRAFSRQPELSSYWLPQWERKAETPLKRVWYATVDEVTEILQVGQQAWSKLKSVGRDRDRAVEAYDDLVTLLHLDDEQIRGSGTLTAATALLLASAFPEHPAQSAQIAASRLHTDTDTIGTMAAAIVGAAAPRRLMSPVLDAEYLTDEADRLYAISQGQPIHGFPYPDLLVWQPPRSAIDATGMSNGRLALAGLSYLTVTGEPIANKDGVWAWAKTDFGQSVLVKLRRELRQLSPTNRPLIETGPVLDKLGASIQRLQSLNPVADSSFADTQHTLFDEVDDPRTTIKALLLWLERNGYRDVDLGKALRLVAKEGSPEEIRLFVDEIAKRV